jgi:hypothetical protein
MQPGPVRSPTTGKPMNAGALPLTRKPSRAFRVCSCFPSAETEPCQAGCGKSPSWQRPHWARQLPAAARLLQCKRTCLRLTVRHGHRRAGSLIGQPEPGRDELEALSTGRLGEAPETASIMMKAGFSFKASRSERFWAVDATGTRSAFRWQVAAAARLSGDEARRSASLDSAVVDC